MKPWGCHNRAPLRATVLVQDGWTHEQALHNLQRTRLPVLVALPDPMTKDCQYTLSAPSDPRCTGCRWQGSSKG